MRLIPLTLAAAAFATSFGTAPAAAGHCIQPREQLPPVCVLPYRCWWDDHGIWCEYDH